METRLIWHEGGLTRQRSALWVALRERSLAKFAAGFTRRLPTARGIDPRAVPTTVNEP